MATTRYYGTGRRKSSVARVYLMPGTGKVTINKKDMDDYFGFDTLKVIARQPLELTSTADKFDVLVNVHGGGYTGQAGAIRHGIARALLEADPEFRPVLKKAGFLTRDPRMKERNTVSKKLVEHHSSPNVNFCSFRYWSEDFLRCRKRTAKKLCINTKDFISRKFWLPGFFHRVK